MRCHDQSASLMQVNFMEFRRAMAALGVGASTAEKKKKGKGALDSWNQARPVLWSFFESPTSSRAALLWS